MILNKSKSKMYLSINNSILLFIPFLVILVCLPIQASKLKIDVDGAVFKMDNFRSIWELYYSFPDTSMTYILVNGEYTGKISFDIKIQSQTNTVVEDNWIVEYKSKIPVLNFMMNLVGQKNYELSEGKYTVTLIATDQNDTNSTAKTTFKLIVNSYPSNRLIFSSIQFAQNIEHVSEITQHWSEKFFKNDLYVIPNPSLEIFSNVPYINLYFEIYNGLNVAPDGLELRYTIFDAAKREVFYFPRKKKTESNAMVEYIKLPAESLPSGVYYIQVSTVYPIDRPKDTIIAMKKFYLINPEIPPQLTANFSEDEKYEKSRYTTLSPEEIKTEFEQIRFISTINEIDIFKELSEDDAKRKFLYRFWKIRDTDSNTVINERYFEFQKLISFANTYFCYGKRKDGWKTDRGRVLLKYGMPTQRDIHIADGELKAYEEWSYSEIRGGTTFIFVDIHGYGNFVQVHSNGVGEMQNADWYNEYVKGVKSDPTQDDSENVN